MRKSALCLSVLIGYISFSCAQAEPLWTDSKGFDPVILDKIDKHFKGLITQKLIDDMDPHRSITRCGGDFDAPLLPSAEWDAAHEIVRLSDDDGIDNPPTVLTPAEYFFDQISWDLQLQAHCEALFDIDAMGVPINITVRCSLNPFIRETRLGIEASRYEPGTSGDRTGILQPVKYCTPGIVAVS